MTDQYLTLIQLRAKLSRYNRQVVAAESGISAATLQRISDGKNAHESTRRLLSDYFKKIEGRE